MEEDYHVYLDRTVSDLQALENGWLNGDGLSIERVAISWAVRIATILHDCGGIRSQVYAEPGGGVSVCWSTGTEDQEVPVFHVEYDTVTNVVTLMIYSRPNADFYDFAPYDDSWVHALASVHSGSLPTDRKKA